MLDVPDMPELTPEEQLRADVLSICSALGAMEEYQDENGEILTKYAMGDECLGKCDLNQEAILKLDKPNQAQNLSTSFELNHHQLV